MFSSRSFPKALGGSRLPNPNSSTVQTPTAADWNLPFQSYLSLIFSAVIEFACSLVLMPNSSHTFFVNSSGLPYRKWVLDLFPKFLWIACTLYIFLQLSPFFWFVLLISFMCVHLVFPSRQCHHGRWNKTANWTSQGGLMDYWASRETQLCTLLTKVASYNFQK